MAARSPSCSSAGISSPCYAPPWRTRAAPSGSWSATVTKSPALDEVMRSTGARVSKTRLSGRPERTRSRKDLSGQPVQRACVDGRGGPGRHGRHDTGPFGTDLDQAPRSEPPLESDWVARCCERAQSWLTAGGPRHTPSAQPSASRPLTSFANIAGLDLSWPNLVMTRSLRQDPKDLPRSGRASIGTPGL
jgi:hypothetical protein